MFLKKTPAWRKEQFDAEHAYAQQILAAPKGSPARRDAYVRAYSDVIGNIIERHCPGGGESHAPALTAALVEGLLPNHGVVLDLGCGGGSLVAELLRRGYDAYGIDASRDSVIRAQAKLRGVNESADRVAQVEFTTYTTERTFDCIIMDNVIEHIAPDEVHDILAHCFQLLKPRSHLLIITPHRFSGPHDISRLFAPLGSRPQGFHLREYSCSELAHELHSAQFDEVWGYPLHPKLMRLLRMRLLPTSLALKKACLSEHALQIFPLSLLFKLHRLISQALVVWLFPAVVVGIKHHSSSLKYA